MPGAIVECGVFRGASLIRLATFRDIFSNPSAKKIIGFDTFSEYPEPDLPSDKIHMEQFAKGAGKDCITKPQLISVFVRKGISNIELIEGNIIETVPSYAKQHPELRISLLHLDCTAYRPTLVALENLYDRLLPGGLVLLNGYGKEGIEGETGAVDDFFDIKPPMIHKLPFAFSPCYIQKEV